MTNNLNPYLLPGPAFPNKNGVSNYSLYQKKLSSRLNTTTEKTISPQQEELQTLLTTATATYLKKFKVDSRAPYYLRHTFERDMELFPHSFAHQVISKYTQELEDHLVTDTAISKAYFEVETGMRTLSAKFNRYDQEFSVWLTLEDFTKQGYTRFLFLSEQSADTCETCNAYHGHVFSIADVPIPPLHPNCRCELLVMDSQTELLYKMDEQAFIQRFYSERRGTTGGIYLIDHSTFPFGISAERITKIPIVSEHMVLNYDQNILDQDGTYNLASAVASYLSSLWKDGENLIDALLNAQAERSGRKWDNFSSFLDWLTFGIVSGAWGGIVSNFDAMVEDPNLYSIVNFFTFGTLDTLSGAIAPEDPWSLEHWLDIIGTVLIVYSAYKAAINVKEILSGSTDDALRAAGTLTDDVDDLIRNAGLTPSQIDDIIKAPKGQRPNPSTYLSQEYIDQHLDLFRGGATKFYAKAPTGEVGPPDGTFVFPSTYVDDIIAKANGDVSILEELLGFEPGYLGDHPVRVDIINPSGLRIPSGNEIGANQYWIPGGYTAGGIPEAIIDRPRVGEYTVSSIFTER